MVYGAVLVAGMRDLLLDRGASIDDLADALIESLLTGLSPAGTAPVEGDR